MPCGRNTTGVVRIGDTVRRPRQPCSPFVAELLDQLVRSGFDGAPTYLGSDVKGRDIFSYIDGCVAGRRWRRFSDTHVSAAGALLRSFHEATRGRAVCGASSVVCHNDAGPNNVVFRDDKPLALIDFDMAAPGEPIEDLGYAARAWCIASKREPVTDRAAQVRLLVDGYG